mmetsp:Transcript_8135/g.25560  ORF Transcript_8135/g.25560 Transcript_8135/m.25560 type:complete len:246 (-) Transcript_8135:1065-1802(-)
MAHTACMRAGLPDRRPGPVRRVGLPAARRSLWLQPAQLRGKRCCLTRFPRCCHPLQPMRLAAYQPHGRCSLVEHLPCPRSRCCPCAWPLRTRPAHLALGLLSCHRFLPPPLFPQWPALSLGHQLPENRFAALTCWSSTTSLQTGAFFSACCSEPRPARWTPRWTAKTRWSSCGRAHTRSCSWTWTCRGSTASAPRRSSGRGGRRTKATALATRSSLPLRRAQAMEAAAIAARPSSACSVAMWRTM